MLGQRRNDEPNPPIWSTNVKIFHPTDDMAYIRQELYKLQDPICDRINNEQHNQYSHTKNTEHLPHSTTAPIFTCENHFSNHRIAILFAPGIYHDIHFQVGYYVQVLGLGYNVHDVQFVSDTKHKKTDQPNFTGPYVPALEKHLHQGVGTSLDTFWRSGENFTIGSVPSKQDAKNQQNDAVDTHESMIWAVSQAAPLRRIHILGDLYLHDGAAYASGGHFANSQVDGIIFAGGQQQFLFRNVYIGERATGGAWSMVYVGCTGHVPTKTPVGNTRNHTGAIVTVVLEPIVRIEKPFIVSKTLEYDNKVTKFEMCVPKVKWKTDMLYSLDPLLDCQVDDELRDFNRIRVVRDVDPVCTIQEALDDGKDIVLCPGIYTLSATIAMRYPNQILYGLGLATLVAPTDGSPCIQVYPRVPGVRIAGIMLEAPETKLLSFDDKRIGTSTLLIWGKIDSYDDFGCHDNPGAMWDIFVRVGGRTHQAVDSSLDRTAISVDTMVCIYSGHVIGDNLWLWRADHAELASHETSNYPNISTKYRQTEANEYCVQTGLFVGGNDVTISGLAVEHACGHQTVWSGDRGTVYFYQSELPYDTTSYSNMDSDDVYATEHRGYRVEPHVREHFLLAPGIYSNYRNEEIFLSTAIEHPESSEVNVVNPFIVKLDNLGGILSIQNGMGDRTTEKGIPARF